MGARAAVAVVVALVLGMGLLLLPAQGPWAPPRDLVLTGYAVLVALLAVFALFGTEPAMVAGLFVGGAFLLGAAIYGLLGLLSRWSNGA